MLRYTIAALFTSLIVGTAYYLYYQYQLSVGPVDSSREYIFRQSWEESCGLTLSMLLPGIFLYALVKTVFLKKNEHYWPNALLYIFLSMLFLLAILSMTWGIQFSTDYQFLELLLSFSPYLIFPFILRKTRKIIKPIVQ